MNIRFMHGDTRQKKWNLLVGEMIKHWSSNGNDWFVKLIIRLALSDR